MDATVNGEGEEEGKQKTQKNNRNQFEQKSIQFEYFQVSSMKIETKIINIEHKEEKRDKKKE